MKYPIVKPYLPSQDKYQRYVNGIFDRNYLTNNGPLVQLLEQRLAQYLGVDYILLVANGTLALNVAYAALDVSGKVITTPFSFAATTSSLCWYGIEPQFVDINAKTLNLDTTNISTEQAAMASAILAVHVFGNPCQVDNIAKLAKKHQLKVIYDAAHAFTSELSGQALVSYGDAATLSFHATKLFHCVEGGAVIFKDKTSYEKAKKIINFGFDQDNKPIHVGINAKMSEFHAAMGLAVLDDIDYITAKRRELINRYHQKLAHVDQIKCQNWHVMEQRNGAYMPIIFVSETLQLDIAQLLAKAGVQTRRYFYPSLSQVDVYGLHGETPIANDISTRILCLPMYTDLMLVDVDYICDCLIKAIEQVVV
ncbi:MAG: DegT/DnrJ/EryC1/StrS aminotransferase [Robiginitomaculum sp.]|nr:MAG: DegT/DnrJ/EryC1/StrS aminotransferase [Robiginitomaculum sp.]